jgi:hypothetical protein
MTDTVHKWISEFDITDEEKEPLFFLLLKDYKNTFNENKNNHIIDEQNLIIIDGRVEEKCAELKYELDEKEEEVGDLTNEKNSLNATCNNLHSELDSLKNSRQSDISSAVNATKQGQEDHIQYLTNEIKELKDKENDILSDFIKDTTKSSYEAGVIGENEMLAILQTGTWDEVIDSHTKDHSGDFVVKYKNKKYIIDVKNYTDNVPAKEVRKLAKDIETNSCDGGAIISLNSGILNPNTNCLTKDKIHQIVISGKSVLLLSDASCLNREFINCILKLLYCDNNSGDYNNNIINEKCKNEIGKSILKMEKEILSESKSFQRMITKKRNDLEHLKNTLNEINIITLDEFSDDDSPKPQNKYNVREMRTKLTEKGIDIEGLKGKALKTKFNELYDSQ